MTPMQINLARHALGLPNRSKRSYRNRFYAAADGEHRAAWDAMVSAGDAAGEPARGGMMFFCLTVQGAREALNRDEVLDPEDFPACPALSISSNNRVGEI